MDAGEAVKVWDLPTRIFHWAILLLVVTSWRTAEMRAMDWHYISGVSALGLIVFRLVWGFVGGSTARFSDFLRSPAIVLRYIRRGQGAQASPGHNPAGGYSVVAMLVALIGQIGTGLFAADIDGLDSGPLSYLVTFDQARLAASLHGLFFNGLLILIALHLLAIIWYRIRHGRKLVGPMVTGRDAQLAASTASVTSHGPVRLIVAIMFAALLAWWIGQGLRLPNG
ncbi:cytochrome b/b6 domain-containing protein [Sphingobium sufflavum]|uniref:cytochrome b/b6 domain-containing protein n=1 Tax=Sphingobium sufflavum TaxID=1129547 RepID=UPI001F263EB6|nr:cytochrome b/b6 domain-containing protein [Sphingobium sufflavum]MCE7798275.1 cytochrome b/b6 domain-containing protein [Sphingobium sufflavum]